VGHYSETILSQLRDIDGVLDGSITDRQDDAVRLRLMISNRTAVLPRIMQILVDGGTEIYDCRLDALPLEEIFLHALNTDIIKENS
jgi:hypothetical protein